LHTFASVWHAYCANVPLSNDRGSVGEGVRGGSGHYNESRAMKRTLVVVAGLAVREAAYIVVCRLSMRRYRLFIVTRWWS